MKIRIDIEPRSFEFVEYNFATKVCMHSMYGRAKRFHVLDVVEVAYSEFATNSKEEWHHAMQAIVAHGLGLWK